MKNIRRFQRTTLVGFVGLNSIVYTEMKDFPLNEQLVLVLSVILGTTCLLLMLSKLSRFRKIQHEK
jgi:hypothetical protein